MNWYRTDRDGVSLQIQAQPGAKRTEVAGLHGGCLKVRLASPPADGKANECLVRFLAQRLGVKRNQVTIIRGLSSRRKTVMVDAVDIQPAALLDQHGNKAD